MAESIKEELKSGEKIIGIWGLGYIGLSSMAYFAKAGVNCLGTDVNEKRVQEACHGKASIPNLEYWLGFNSKQLTDAGLVTATVDWRKLIDKNVGVHLITVPTEMDGKPFHDFLVDVMTKLCNFKDVETENPPLVIVESTLTPTVMDNIVFPLLKGQDVEPGKDMLLGVAPRRDWFTSSDKNLANIPRVVGGTTPETTDLMAEVLGIISKTVLKAKDHKHAAIVKSIENSYRQMDITFANQLSLAYPDLDMTSILKLVGTKWNIGTYHPSFGTGGYCIPLAPHYVLEGARYPEKITLLKSSITTDTAQPHMVVESIIKRGAKKVGILGLTYAADLKVHVLSPTLPIVRELKKARLTVKVQDPYYDEEEIRKIVDVETFKFPEDLPEFDTILLVAPHMQYKYVNSTKILDNLKNCKLILDNMGAWKDLNFPDSIEYHEAGDEHWLG